MDLKSTDVCDAHGDTVAVAEPVFQDFGGKTRFGGAIATVKTFEDNALIRRTLETPGEGRVLVVDGAGSMRCALLGDNLAALALKNGWSGVIIYGCIRDSEEIGKLPIGVKALATHPRKSAKKDYGEINVPVAFAGVTFTPGHYVYADLDGIVVSAAPAARGQ